MHKHILTKHIIHFHRWSRKAYAIFASIGRQVKISRLRVDMCQGELLKSGKGTLATFFDTHLQERSSEDQDPPLPDLLLPILIMNKTTSSDAQVIAGSHSYIP